MSNSRLTHQGSQVWRRRYCEKCGRTFTTRENVELGFLEVLKLNGSLEPFSRSKLIFSVMDALSHLSEQTDASVHLVETIERKILKNLKAKSNKITTADIMRSTSEVLKLYDPLSHLKYVSQGSQAITSKRELKLLIKDSN